MKEFFRGLRLIIYGLAGITVIAAALFSYFIYTPDPGMPHLSGTLTRSSMDVGGLSRTYVTYVPQGTGKAAPVVLVLHGAGESASRIRSETGYGFERLADERRFVVVYPNAYKGYWNACGSVREASESQVGADDVTFLTELVQKRAADIGFDARRAFAVGSSRGGFMAIRLALEAPASFRAVAVVSANVHTPDNFKCKPSQTGTSSLLIMNGTQDPLVPFDGGDVSLLGFSYKYGRVLSSQKSAQYFADLNHIAAPPSTNEAEVADGVRVKRMTWHNGSNVEIELLAIEGGGHGIPQPYRRHPRLLGPSPKEPNGPEVIWAFFDRQSR